MKNYLINRNRSKLQLLFITLSLITVSTSCTLISNSKPQLPPTLIPVEITPLQISSTPLSVDTEPTPLNTEVISPPLITPLPTLTPVATEEPINIVETQEAFENDPPLTLPANLEFPLPMIKIYVPGDMSKVVSPFRVVIEVPNALYEILIIEIFGEDGRVLHRQEIDDFGDISLPDAAIIREVDFDIEAVAEFGKLKITLIDSYNRPKAINTINLILLREGTTEITGYGDLQDNLFLQYPLPNSINEGESVFISGYIRDINNESIFISLLDENSQILGEVEATILEIEESVYSLFLGSVELVINSPIEVRLMVVAKNPENFKTHYLSSMLIRLEP